jgi:hypothetical protein
MHRWGKQAPLHFDEKELKTDLGIGNFIFVGSSCDMWANASHLEWIGLTLAKCSENGNRYLFQSKNPERFISWKDYIPKGSTLCTTIESDSLYPQMGNTPEPFRRAEAMSMLGTNFLTMITIEPIFNFNIDKLVCLIRIASPNQVNIGADSGNNHLPEPNYDDGDKILELIEALSKFTKVVQKKNLRRLIA